MTFAPGHKVRSPWGRFTFSKKITLVCGHCLAKFARPRCEVDGGPAFCSRKCSDARRRKAAP